MDHAHCARQARREQQIALLTAQDEQQTMIQLFRRRVLFLLMQFLDLLLEFLHRETMIAKLNR
jgi:hypothetical protein